MKSFEVQFRFRDRTESTVESTIKAEASSLPGAVGKAVREFVKGLDRRQRFDMNKSGLEITAKSACAGMVSSAPRYRRLILPSKALGLARKIAIIILCRSESDRSPTRQAMPRSVAFAPTLI